MKNLVLFTLSCFLCLPVFAQLNCNASMSLSVNQHVVTLTNNSTPTQNGNMDINYVIYWGDGGTTSVNNNTTQVHGYRTPGVYHIKLWQWIYDSVARQGCADSVLDSVTVLVGKPCAASITTTGLGNNQWRFTATNLNATPGLTYAWDFGDGSTGTGSPATHLYVNKGSYVIRLIASNGSCTDTQYTYQYIQTTINPCSVKILNPYMGNYTFQFFADNIYGTTGLTYTWDFGDGNTGTGSPVTHSYSGVGSRWVTLISSKAGCTDTARIKVTTTPVPNVIYGRVFVDSMSVNLTDSVKVWLIKFDSLTNLLTAVDSQTMWVHAAYYQFNNKPGGKYLTKAHLLNGQTSGTGYIPTYHDSDLLWSGANAINHIGLTERNTHIYMRTGTVTGGPGFVGGNVSQGANKGTGNGIEGMNVILMDGNDNPIAFSITDANGNYKFTNVAYGSYKVHPEDMNYATTPASITLSGTQPSYNGVSFERSKSAMTIRPKATGIANANATHIDFRVYPNPAKDIVNIEWGVKSEDNVTITLMDITGKTIESLNTTMTNDVKMQLDAVQSGIYMLNISTDYGSYTQKLVLQ